MATPLEEITSKPPQPDLSDSDPRHCRVLSPHPHADSLLQEGGLPSDYARHPKIQPVEIANGRDPRRPIEERYFSKLRSQRLFRTCPVLASVADGHIAGHILEEGVSHGLSGNISDEGTSTVHNLVSRGASPSGKFDSIAHEHARSILLQGGRWSADGTAKSPESAFGCQTWGPQFPQARGVRGTNHLKPKPIAGGDGSGLRSWVVKARSHGSLEYDVPTMWNVSGEGTSTIHNPISCGASPSSEFDVLAHEHSDIDLESSHVQFFNQTRQIHSGLRWTILGDSLMDVIVQGPFALVGLKMSNASSPAKDVLVRVVVIVYAVGFLSAMGGKLRGSSIMGGIGAAVMGGIGSTAAVLGFLLTMILLLL